MLFSYTRAVGFACLLLVLAACHTPCLPCVSGQMRTSPIYVDPEAFRALSIQIDCLNHRFKPYERAMDRLHFPKRICKRLVQIDNDLQHVNAELISREVAPEKMQRQVDRIERSLSRVEAQLGGLIPPMERCCTSPSAMSAALDAGVRLAAKHKPPQKIRDPR